MSSEELKIQVARLAEDDDIFRLQLSRLRQGSATESKPDSLTLQTIDEAAIGLVETLVKHIRESRLTPTMADLLADHLSRVGVEQSLDLFGLNKANRPTTKMGQQTSAIHAFTDALRLGLDQKKALIKAYDAYFSTGPLSRQTGKRRTYADDSNRDEKGSAATMKSTIRPLLVEMRLLPKPSLGRPKKTS